MKHLTPEQVNPWLTKETKLWTEDDATMHCCDHESSTQAWVKVFGCKCPSADTAVAICDFGDGGCRIFADGRVQVWMCDGGAIHQIPPEGMQALGLPILDAEGAKKTQLHLLPPIALAEAAKAHQQGSEKYGPYNWRGTKVCASTYISAMMRHLDLWRDGEDLAPDSGVSHLGHIIASANILLDAAHCGTLVDDRAKVTSNPHAPKP